MINPERELCQESFGHWEYMIAFGNNELSVQLSQDLFTAF